jgi:SusD/RagB-like outer membrane lipoprotein
MKKLILIALLIGLASCEDFQGWNIDTKHPSSVNGDFLFTSAQRVLARDMQSTNVNINIFKMFAQQWTETTYTDEANYDLANRNIGGVFWNSMYQNVLADLNEAKNIISADASRAAGTKANQLAVIDLVEVFTWHILVDTYGDIPYSEALAGIDNLVPKYDNDEDIYTDLFSRLDADIAQLNGGGVSFGGADLFYNGSTSSWVKFANSLKLKMAVRIADFNSSMASSKATEAVSGGVFSSAADNMAFPFETTPPNTNPIWESLVQSGRKDFIVSNTFVDLIVPLNDPRTTVFMDDNQVPYVGGPYGENNSYGNYTHIGSLWFTEDVEGLMMSYSEVEFLMAEAIERGLISGTAETHYKAAVSASIIYFGGSQADADTYLAQPAIDYTTIGNWKEAIGVQKWLSLYGRGFEAWSSWRLLDYPNTMNRPPVSVLPIPRRYIYPNGENDVNQANYTAASTAMGGDNLDSRVFWDIVGTGN